MIHLLFRPVLLACLPLAVLTLPSCVSRKEPQSQAQLRQVNTQNRLLDSDTQCPAPVLRGVEAIEFEAQLAQRSESQRLNVSRSQQIERLRSPDKGGFDMVVVGGGATGLAACLQATVQGLRVACVDKGDFASGTSSRSTKLIHGGVRYLESAIVSWLPFLERWENAELVAEGLRERSNFLKMAPHLTSELRIITPVYGNNWLNKIWNQQYLKAGLLAYDTLAMRHGLERTRSMRATDKGFAERYSFLRKASKATGGQAPQQLVGVVEYSDGQFNDARMAVSLAMTALKKGAVVVNHMELTALLKDESGRINAVQLKDLISGQQFSAQTHVVVNATGPGLDEVRLKLDDPQAEKMVIPKPGTHIVIDADKMPLGSKGILIPKAENGSVGFLKPFENKVVIGTTEEPLVSSVDNPRTKLEYVDYLVRMANSLLEDDRQISRDDVKSVWTGVRPLVLKKEQLKTADVSPQASRKHRIEVSEKSGLVSIGGGKWTSFGAMGREVVARAVEEAALTKKVDGSKDLADEPLLGGQGFHSDLCHHIRNRLAGIQGSSPVLQGKALDQAAVNLARNYGTKAPLILDLIETKPELARPLVPGLQYLAAEAVYATREEMALTPADVLARRTRLAFIDHDAAVSAVSEVFRLMEAEIDWPNSYGDVKLKSQNELNRMKPKELSDLI